MIQIHSSQTNFMQIGLATSEEIQNWAERSYFLDGQFIEIGEVKKADTINYRTFKPEKDGLFCERIFGPVNDWICSCGQWSGAPQSQDSSFDSRFNRASSKSPKLWNVLRGNRSKLPGILFDLKRWPKAFIRSEALSTSFPLSASSSVLSSFPASLETHRSEVPFFAKQKMVHGSKGETESEESTKVNQQKAIENSSKNLSGKKFGSTSTKCLICPNCQVEITLSRIRRYRMGFISLACSVTHVWFLNSRPNIFSVLMKMPTKYVKKINYYKGYSPSQPLFFNPCLGPGGDFFDTEWEFLHRWFGASLSDGLRPMIRINSRAKLSNQAFRLSVPSLLRNERNGKLTHETKQKNERKLTKRRQNQSFHQSNKINHHFPEYPSWLENTGANAFHHHFENQNWAKEFQKLHQELKQSPSLITPAHTLERTIFCESKNGTLPLLQEREMEIRGSSLTGEVHQTNETLEIKNDPTENKMNEAKNQRLASSEYVNPFFVSQKMERKAKNGIAKCIKKEFISQSSIQHINFLLKRRKKRVRKLKLLNILRTAGHLTFSRKISQDSFGSFDLIEVPTIPIKASTVKNYASHQKINQSNEFSVENRLALGTENLQTRKDDNRPSSQPFIFTKIPVLPPELRPIVQLNAGQLASSDVNDLYRRVVSRNNRLKYYLTSCGPHLVEFLVRSEQHLVQLSVDALFENGKTSGTPGSGKERSFEGSRDSSGRKQVYKSLSDRIGGKQGRFRQNLLGKRVDYSGRSVIVVGPKLKLNECGLPICMATELFQAFLIRHILELQLAKTIRGAKNILRYNEPLTRQLLQNVVQSHPILLNRAPTLHRLGIQAFQPKLVSGRAIQLHPLVCSAFNADFDGDQMAVHLPLSAQARVEARLLMLANTNWFSPATGQPSILPSQDMVLGFYYLTIENPISCLRFQQAKNDASRRTEDVSVPNRSETLNSFPPAAKDSENIYSSLNEVIQDYESGFLTIHSQIWVTEKVTEGSLALSSEVPSLEARGREKLKTDYKPISSAFGIFGPGSTFKTPPPPYRKTSSSISFSSSSSFNSCFGQAEKGSDNGNKPQPEKMNALASRLLQSNKRAQNELSRLPQEKLLSAYSDLGGKPGKSLDEPLFVRVLSSGGSLKLFPSYKWIEDSNEKRTNLAIRTTPGRILVNQLILYYSQNL